MADKYFQKNKIQRLRTLVKDALLIEKDRVFVRDIITRIELSTVNKKSMAAYTGLERLLNQDKIIKAKITRRFAAKKIDIFKQNLYRFTDKELIIIAKSCHLIQMTDGCTVACSWCYLNAQPYIQFAVSYLSIRRFLTMFARYLPEPTRFYWASDPLDWYDDEKSYVDLVKEFYTSTGNTKSMITTTSLPMGTEITFLRLVQWFDTHLSFKQTKSFVGDEQHYQKNSVMKGLFYKKSLTYDIHTLFDYFIKNKFYHQNTHHVLKISETDANYKRLKATFDVLKFMEISQSCLSWIEIETRDVGNFDGVRKSGRAFGWNNRDIILDNVSMACWDSVILFPGKVGAMEMCGVTSTTQRGLEFWLVEQDKQIIPQVRAIIHYEYYDSKNKEKHYLLPYVEMTEYVKGALMRRWTHYSLKRDIQAYGLLLSKTIPIMQFIASQTHKKLENFQPWNEMCKQYEKRKIISNSLMSEEKDEETLRLIAHLIAQIDMILAS